MTGETQRAHKNAALYEVLQVSPHASQEVIHGAYRALARTCHPDLNASAAAAQRMAELNAAFDVLGDSQRRAQYDLQQLRSSRKPLGVQPVSSAARRGTLPARSPRRLEAERTPVSRQRTWASLVLAMSVVLLLVLLLWVVSVLLDDDPSPYALSPGPRTATVASVLNRFLTVNEQALTVSVAESGHDGILG
jgi:hypothetical protein